MYLLKLQTRKHGNSIYFMRDNMVCFPKSGHNYILANNCNVTITMYLYYRDIDAKDDHVSFQEPVLELTIT